MSKVLAVADRRSSTSTKGVMAIVVCMAALAALAWPAGAVAYTPTDVNTAVANGVAYIDSQQQPDGHFGSSYPVAETGLAIVAYGTLDGGDFTKLSATYQAHLTSAVSYLLTQQDPTSGGFAPGSGVDNYSTGIALEALSLSTGVDPGIPAAITKGRSYLISEQNAPPAVTGNPSSPNCTGADGSGTEGYCGGWSYELGDFGGSDESNTGFALTGLALTGGVPAASAAVNVEWQRHVQQLRATNPLATANDGQGCYVPVSFCNANDTGSLLFGFGYDRLPASDPKVAAAILIAQDTLDEYELNKASVRSSIAHTAEERDGTCMIGAAGCTWAVHGDGGYHYSIWAVTKGLGQYIAGDVLLTDPTNWYDKVVDLLLSQQGGDGSWPFDPRDDGSIIGATSFAVSALSLVGATSDLSITKTDSPDPVTVGATLTYTLTVQNGGPLPATGVTVTDNLPAGVTFVSATPSQGSCSQTGGTVTCTIGNLANGASATAEIKITPQNAGTITNTAEVKGDQSDLVTSNNTATENTTVQGGGGGGGGAAQGRMTGGGTIAGTSVHHGFELHCDKTKSPNNLEVNWGKGNRFHLESLTSAACSDDPSISEGQPVAAFDTYRGTGTGTYNGKPGATAEWVMTDAGEPGRNDTLQIKVTDASGNVVLDVSGKITGNHQAHPG
jgi:uncharacterized repeat protein (TIGR01451 family)